MVDNTDTVTTDQGAGTSSESGSQISSAILKLPPFWSNRPDLWFLRIETQFRMRGITSSQTKYDYVVSSLESDAMEIIADVLLNPPQDENLYGNLKRHLIDRCRDTEEKRLDELLSRMELGDLRPSELYRKMESLATGNSLVNTPLLKKLWLGKLPYSMQPCIIAIEGTHNQREVFEIADKIFDSTDRPKVAAVASKQEGSNLEIVLNKITKRLDDLEVRHSQSRSRSSTPSGSWRSRSRSQSRPGKNKLCWYHHRFANHATKCNPPCEFKSHTEAKN